MAFKTTKLLLFSLVFSFISISASAQGSSEIPCIEKSKKIRTNEYQNFLSDAKNGALLIEFPSYHRQVEYFDKQLQKLNISIPSRKRIEKLKSEWIETNENSIQYILEAFEKHYRFGPVRAYIRSDRKLITDPSAPIWLDKDQKKVTKGPINSFVIITPRGTDNFGLEAYVLLDKSFKTPCPPAPQYFKLNGIKTLFKFGKKEKRYKAMLLARNVQKAFGSLNH